jgi:hypothetical protein
LLHFVRYFWHVLEPAQPLVEGRVLEVIAMHLEAVTRGEIRRLLINDSPGSMKFAAGHCVLVAAAAGMASTFRLAVGSYTAARQLSWEQETSGKPLNEPLSWSARTPTRTLEASRVHTRVL